MTLKRLANSNDVQPPYGEGRGSDSEGGGYGDGCGTGMGDGLTALENADGDGLGYGNIQGDGAGDGYYIRAAAILVCVDQDLQCRAINLCARARQP